MRGKYPVRAYHADHRNDAGSLLLYTTFRCNSLTAKDMARAFNAIGVNQGEYLLVGIDPSRDYCNCCNVEIHPVPVPQTTYEIVR